ncbi:MAG: TolC family protein [Candidatus Thiodiazotropha sp. (ex Epidulcina cf. delphinae)]|nr:TolC family protein [Candidatus Thiodiazotropha sp. (ex Epidulcina cf. delphinae)]
MSAAAGGSLCLTLGLGVCWPVFSQEPLPSPLTLQYALELAGDVHPERVLADAALARAQAHRRQVGASEDVRVDLTAELRAIEPSDIAVDQTHNDSLARLSFSKQLYDFGRTTHAEAAAEAGLESRQWHLLEVKQQRRLDVMAHFFAVLLADLEYARDNEALSIAFIRFDRARAKNELGKVSDIGMLELESSYQQSRRRMNASRNRQRITRSQLAISLNRPLDLPSDLEMPVLEASEEIGDIDALVEQALRENPRLGVLRAELLAAREQLQTSEAENNPILRAELEAVAYRRELGGRNPLTAALVLELPLYTGNRVAAEVAEARALIQQKQAALTAYEYALRQQLLDYWMELDRRRLQREELQVTEDYRDLYLDRSRTLYEMDVATDLGNAMTQIADIQFERAKNEFQIHLIRARVQALTGGASPE